MPLGGPQGSDRSERQCQRHVCDLGVISASGNESNLNLNVRWDDLYSVVKVDLVTIVNGRVVAGGDHQAQRASESRRRERLGEK